MRGWRGNQPRNGGNGRIRTIGARFAHASLAGRCLKPLGHVSITISEWQVFGIKLLRARLLVCLSLVLLLILLC